MNGDRSKLNADDVERAEAKLRRANELLGGSIRSELLDQIAALAETESPLDLLADAAEEMGELSRALRKDGCAEPAYMEAVDLAICSLALYFRTGGVDVAKDIAAKVRKWNGQVMSANLAKGGKSCE